MRGHLQLIRMIARSQLNAGQKISGELIVTCCDSAKVLELVEEALDEVALCDTGQNRMVMEPRVEDGKE